MIGVILAAGLGARLGGRAKALFELDGVTLIERCARVLASVGLSELVIVTGHEASAVERAWRTGADRRMSASFIYNPSYAELNNFHTLALACDRCHPGPLLVLNSDIVFTPDVIEGARAVGGDLALAVEPGATDEEALKVSLRDGEVEALGKGLPPARAHGEFIGVSVLSPRGRSAYLAAAVEARRCGETDLYYEDVYSRVCRSVESRVAEVGAGHWAEIDVPEDVPAAHAVVTRLAHGVTE